MSSTSKKREIVSKLELSRVKSKASSSQEGAFLQIKEFDQATRKRVKDRVY